MAAVGATRAVDDGVRKKKLLITGGAGLIGQILSGALADEWDILSMDRTERQGCVRADIADLEEISPLFEGCDAVVHLAGDSHVGGDLGLCLPEQHPRDIQRLRGGKACQVRRMVFASSNHVTGLYEAEWPISAIVKGEFDGISPSQVPMIDHLTAPRPDSLYGVSKQFGEGIGAFYAWVARRLHGLPPDRDRLREGVARTV